MRRENIVEVRLRENVDTFLNTDHIEAYRIARSTERNTELFLLIRGQHDWVGVHCDDALGVILRDCIKSIPAFVWALEMDKAWGLWPSQEIPHTIIVPLDSIVSTYHKGDKFRIHLLGGEYMVVENQEDRRRLQRILRGETPPHWEEQLEMIEQRLRVER